MANLNPLGILGPTSPAPYQQPNTAAPPANAAVASYTVGSNVLGISWPISKYVHPDNPPKPVQTGGTLL